MTHPSTMNSCEEDEISRLTSFSILPLLVELFVSFTACEMWTCHSISIQFLFTYCCQSAREDSTCETKLPWNGNGFRVGLCFLAHSIVFDMKWVWIWRNNERRKQLTYNTFSSTFRESNWVLNIHPMALWKRGGNGDVDELFMHNSLCETNLPWNTNIDCQFLLLLQ